MTDITHRLRCLYPMGPTVDGEPEFGWRDFSGPAPEGVRFPTPLMREAADEIDRLSAALKAAKSQIEADREALLCCHGLDGVIPADDQLGRDGLAEYDEVLNTITAALGSGNGDAT